VTRAEGCATDLAAVCPDLLGPVAAAVILHGSLGFGQLRQAAATSTSSSWSIARWVRPNV
jgi:hypothetical protein